jgi:predicted ATP-grasp superfamily ATP-dependent carboligase
VSNQTHLHFEITPAVVLGACGHGLAVIHALGSNGIPVIVVESDQNLPGAKTNAARVIFVATMNGEYLIDSLIDLRQGISCPGKPVLFLANDRMVRLLGLNWERLADLFSLSWSGCRERLLPLLDKSSLERRCSEVGLLYPETRIIEFESDVDPVLDALGFPLILKPVRPLSGFKTIIPESRQEILEALAHYRDDLPFIAQHLIPGDDRYIFFSAFYLSEGKVLARFDGHKLRSRPLGHTTIGESSISDSVFERTLQFFAGLELSGPVSLELKRDGEENFWVIEPTLGRTDFWVGLCIENGVNFPLVEYCHQVGMAMPSTRQLDRAIWFNEERDPFGIFWLALQADLKFRGRKATFLYLHPHDPKPLIIGLNRIFGGFLRSAIRRASRVLPGKKEAAFKCNESYSLNSLDGEFSEMLDTAEYDSIYCGVRWYENLVSTVFTCDPGVRFCQFYKNGRPVALFPLHFSKTGFGQRVESLGNYYTPLYSPVFNESVADEIVSDVVREIEKSSRNLALMRFSPMDPEFPIFGGLRRGLRGAGWIPFEFFCFGNWYLKVDQGWDAYLKSRSGILRATLRRSMSKLTRDGGRLEMVTEHGDIEKAIAAYLAVYSHSGKRLEPFPEFIPGLVRLAAKKHWLRMGIAWLGSRPIGAQIWFVANGKADIYKLAYDSRDKMYSPGTLLTSMLMQHVFEQDCVSEVDYLIGDDLYKKQWMSHRRERWGIVAYNPKTFMGALGLIREILGRIAKRIFSGFARQPRVKHAD